ncbi:MAG: ParB/RepB/Spo0J family partition protein [Solobacterium sp.]|nr:ParB/RepB/Spo0J family partition protein [Solobacterium sp.]MBR3203198.1 ParB/RepB/Spo0J family partition protein [Solobacterium sp.]MBR3346053.1 ParB/RepB/Spo0J family partition protein [Solobacterium sp.]
MADKKKSGLGKGLTSIFGADVEQFLDDIQNNGGDAPGRKEVEIPIAEIRANPYQPRKEFDEKSLRELADSIGVHGIFTPLLVRRSVQGYELIAGERRLRAAKLAGLTRVPAISVDFTDEEMMEISILENVQRENLNPIEEAAAYESLIKRLGYTQEKLAERVGKSREYCANMLRLLRLPQPVQEMVTEKQLTMGHVRPLLALEDEDEMFEAAEKIRKEKMSVREVERYIKELTGGDRKKQKQKKEPEKDPLIRDIENRMSSKLGTKVSITGKTVNIQFTDTADLNRILELLGMLEETNG